MHALTPLCRHARQGYVLRGCRALCRVAALSQHTWARTTKTAIISNSQNGARQWSMTCAAVTARLPERTSTFASRSYTTTNTSAPETSPATTTKRVSAPTENHSHSHKAAHVSRAALGATVPSKHTPKGDGDGDGDGDGGAARPTPAVSRSSSVGFAKLGLNALLAAPLAEWNIITPTDVQAKGWKPISFGNNTLLAAHTGTGKTLAYALPIVQRYIDNDLTFPRYSTLCLVPTRELAVQVHSVFVALLSAVVGDKASQHVHCVVKGIENSTPKKQLRKLKRENPPIIIATPARFLELLEKHPIADEVETVVLDEADKLLDPLSRYASPKQKQNRERHPRPTTTIMDLIVYRRKFGPGEDRRPYRQMAQRPQVICASASLTTRVKRELVQRGWCAPQSITTVSLTDGQTLPDNLQHFVVNDAVCAKFDMPYIGAGSTASQADCLFAQLEWTLSALAPATALVFVPTSVPVKDTTNRIAQFRARTRTAVDAIAVYEHVHAATSPADAAQRREDLLARFASATPERPVVGVANMDAIRGLDIPNVELACIVGTPRTHVDYLHIAGRVGRGNRQGTVVVFAYDEQQQKRVDQMARKLRISIPQLSPTNGGPGIAGGAGDDGAGADTNHAAGSNLSSPPTDTPTQRR
ncbi:hypothetical protein PTSG_00554 [Salpingoeca rosetta]|uniref:ATP-dependent RNA helicase n=1 Tax=Salpingoeca rosetta (strain ATCC 50818 / BSB-021) TaxID=946362 RepID=F2TWT5_SALR5|nr:uncharacterized protein PTSG_00554 [Salpingoeca rosetta]EGD72531.1 hypothetical protein PTSG_00554 [Salpingoeca rosetta]|eukprot:XP_004999100.1 hypothetical protein PTSG_00554 [Salpingoeca rosetta]